MKILTISLLLFCLSLTTTAQVSGEESGTKSLQELVYEAKSIKVADGTEDAMSTRKLRAIFLSGMIPGTGQTYLGSELKGVGITIGFTGSVLAAVINHNNFTTREDRISNLLLEYKQANSYAAADAVWQTIEIERVGRDKDDMRRKYFSYAAVAIWIYNIVDIIYLTEDEGVEQFALSPSVSLPSFAYTNQHDQILTFRINLF